MSLDAWGGSEKGGGNGGPGFLAHPPSVHELVDATVVQRVEISHDEHGNAVMDGVRRKHGREAVVSV